MGEGYLVSGSEDVRSDYNWKHFLDKLEPGCRLTPQDAIWRVLERLRETKEIVAASAEELHPVHNQDIISTLHEVERLMQTQIHLMHRIQRRYP